MKTSRLLLMAATGAVALAGCSEQEAPPVAGKIESSPRSMESSKPLAPVVPVAASATLDKDGDGRISSDEAPTDMLLRWDEWDANADGFIDASEQEAMRRKLEGLPPEKAVVLTVSNSEAAEKKPQDPKPGDGGSQDPFATADADGDGRLSKAEAPERMRERFDLMDANGDGFVDAAEIAAVRDKMQRERGGKGGGGGRPGGGGGFGGGGGGRRPSGGAQGQEGERREIVLPEGMRKKG